MPSLPPSSSHIGTVKSVVFWIVMLYSVGGMYGFLQIVQCSNRERPDISSSKRQNRKCFVFPTSS
jgi:hypothetical protein